MRKLVAFCLPFLIASVLVAKDHPSAEQCNSDGMCLQTPNYDPVGDDAMFSIVLVNRSDVTIHNCRVKIPVRRGDLIVDTAYNSMMIGLRPGEKYWFKALMGGGWDIATELNLRCSEGQWDITFAEPLFPGRLQRALWRRKHKNDRDTAQDAAR